MVVVGLELSVEELGSLAGRCLGRPLHDLRYISGGRNNRVARAESAAGPVLVKSYFHDPEDSRDRLGSEFETLQLLWRSHLRCIPEPLACDHEGRVAVYEFVDGRPGSEVVIQRNDVFALADFLNDMAGCCRIPAFADRPCASDACFSLMDYLRTVERRLIRLERMAESVDFEQFKLDLFLENEFRPVFAEIKDRVCALSNLNLNLTLSERILSPSDHGFHNAIKRADGRWIFVDFEYAGWDDPAKMLADACLHPGVPIPPFLRESFIERVLSFWDKDGRLGDRLRVVYPLVGLKWCLIILNEFVPVSSKRRVFAEQLLVSPQHRWRQLEMARQKLNEVIQNIHGKSWIPS